MPSASSHPTGLLPVQLTAVRLATLANVTGQAWALLLSLAMIPIYIRWMGLEVYGLLGFHITLMAASVVLDLGLSGTVNRELARSAVEPDTGAPPRTLVRTLEWVVWPLALILALAVASVAGWLSSQWLRPVTLDAAKLRDAVILMGLAVASQWPAAFYGGALAGMQRQVLLNGLNIVFGTLRSIGVLLPLSWFGADVVVFFTWQVAIGLLHSLSMAAVTWSLLPRRSSDSARFDPKLLRAIGGFASALAGTALMSFLLMHVDRMVLSTAISLDAFGQYALAVSLGAAIHRFILPVQSAVYPQYSQLVAGRETERLTQLHHNASQIIAVVVIPLVVLMAVFAERIITVWTGDAALGSASGPILSLLVIGYGLNGLTLVPFTLALAAGTPRLQFRLLAAGVAIAVPATWFAAHQVGAVGPAGVWLILNVAYLLLGLPLIHRRVLVGELGRWWRTDMLPAVVVSLVLVTAAWMVVPQDTGRLAGLAWLLGLGGLMVGACALACEYPRSLLKAAAAGVRGRANAA